MTKKAGWKMTIFLILLGPMIALGATYFLVQFLIFQPIDKNGKDIAFEILTGERGVTIAQRLEDEGIIKNAYAFFAYNIALDRYHAIKSGRYLLSPSMTIAEISDVITRGQSLPEIVITFPEGLNLKQWQEKLSEYFSGIDLFSYRAEQFQDEFDFLKDVPSEATLEGYLYPDTYYLSYQMNSDEIVKRFLSNFNVRLDNFIKEVDTQGLKMHEVVTIASLLEKEVKESKDRQLVAGLINKRLKIGMPLQIDATITYLTDQADLKASRLETEIDSPYNTYLYKGLPIGPICNPGYDSIEAVLNPLSSDYLYYLSTPDGEIIFSRNLTEHNQAKAKYLK